MEVENPPLALTESADVDDSLRLDPHTLKRGPVRNGRHYEGAGILETDEAPIEQMVDAGCLQPSILPIEPLFVGRIAPGLAVARNEVNRVFDTRDSASPLDVHHAPQHLFVGPHKKGTDPANCPRVSVRPRQSGGFSCRTTLAPRANTDARATGLLRSCRHLRRWRAALRKRRAAFDSLLFLGKFKGMAALGRYW